MESGPLFRWSKRVPEKEVETWENRLTIEGLPYVVEKAVGRERWQFNVYGGDRDELDSLRHRLGGGVVRVRPEDWQPTASDEPVRLKIRDRLLVVEETETEDLARLGMEFPGREILSFPPQMAFGTGGHQTTATCLRQLVDETETLTPGEWNLLDLGCGSGILAIAGARLGAKAVTAIENDLLASDVARTNAERHGVSDRVTFIEGDAIGWTGQAGRSGRRFNIVAANLFSDLLVELMPNVPDALASEGRVIVSGFLTTQAKAVHQAARDAGIDLFNFVRRGKWVTAVGRHS
ncbi:MAG: 50S ribosomal protein L11 methyltransferase [Verrucomicrobiae bacterium]|nr:50S ribosomal protein L11 methyltransferase [Verrucomicrobiae bacterium]